MQAEQQITALYDRLSRDDEPIGESNSIANHLAYLGYAFNIHAVQRIAGDMLAIRRGAMNGTMEELLSNAITGSTRVPNRSAEVHTSCPITFESPRNYTHGVRALFSARYIACNPLAEVISLSPASGRRTPCADPIDYPLRQHCYAEEKDMTNNPFNGKELFLYEKVLVRDDGASDAADSSERAGGRSSLGL